MTIRVTGLRDMDSVADFDEKLTELLRRDLGNYSMSSLGGPDRRTITVSPVAEPKRLADGITWATVTGVKGREITVRGKPLAAAERRPAETDFFARVLFDLKSPALQRRKEALGRLANTPADSGRREEVAQAILPMLKDPDGFARSDAAKALAVWGGPESVPALVEALRDPAFNVKWAVLDTLAALKDPAAAEPLAALLGTNDRGKAAEALRGIGAAAEPAVIKYLGHGDAFTRMEAAKILGDIGTEQSVAPLQDLIRKTNNHGLDAMAAGEALDKLGAPRFAAPAPRRGGLVPRSRRP